MTFIAKTIYSITKESETRFPTLTIMAAAVSDFYIPDFKISQHKIQSKDFEDGLKINLDPVPKKLKLITENWNPKTFMVD